MHKYIIVQCNYTYRHRKLYIKIKHLVGTEPGKMQEIGTMSWVVQQGAQGKNMCSGFTATSQRMKNTPIPTILPLPKYLLKKSFCNKLVPKVVIYNGRLVLTAIKLRKI